MNILGFSCFGHDSAACLVRDGQIVAAVEEERLTRQKHDNSFPLRAIQDVLRQGKLAGDRLDAVAFYETPSTGQGAQASALSALLESACGYRGQIIMGDHHLSHAALSFYASPFEDAAILIVDAVGQQTTTSLFHGSGTSLAPVATVAYPHSIGLLYAALTSFLGFAPHEGEYKVMGLASYGKPTYLEKLRGLVTLRTDGDFTLDLSYFSFTNGGESLYSPKLVELLGPARAPEGPVGQREMDLAASIQGLIEEILMALARAAKAKTGSRHLCLGGELAHNIVANAKLRDSGLFDELFVHFASGDNGAAMGAALAASYRLSDAPRQPMRPTPYLGPSYGDDAIEEALKNRGLAYEKFAPDALIDRVARLLSENKVVGWHQGRMEFGPRALGSRSILASACCADMKSILNAHVKHREEFRPFAPVVLADRAGAYFDLPGDSPAMLYAAQVREDQRAVIPSVTHVDGSARPQTIRREDNPLYYDVIARFAEITGVPVIVNTSFNIRGEPIVCSPDDAMNCFAGTDIDALAIGSFLVVKS